jgi:hypothetical protein
MAAQQPRRREARIAATPFNGLTVQSAPQGIRSMGRMSEALALWVLFRRKPRLDAATIARALGTESQIEGSKGILSVRRRGLAMRVLAHGVPVPSEIVRRCLPVAHLRDDQKELLASHGAHAFVGYEGAAPGADGLVAMYETAWALRHAEAGGVVGLINGATWMCLTGDMLEQTVAPDFVRAVLASPAESLALWLGFIKLFKPDGSTWFVTRGGWLVGLPDLAWLATHRDGDGDSSEEAFAMLAGILDYAYTSGTDLVVGDAIDLGDRALRLRASYEYVETMGKGTLVVEAR